jgi:hypothetical protein
VGGNVLYTGDTIKPYVSTTRNYYVSAISEENCISENRTKVSVTVNSFPGEPTVFNGQNCGPGKVELSVAGTPEGGMYQWYEQASDGISFHSENKYYVDTTQTVSFWVSIVTAEGCEGTRAEITATIHDLPPAPKAINNQRCGSGQVNIQASSTTGGNFNWFETEASSTSLFTGASCVTPSVTSTTSYWVDITDTNQCISPRTKVLATIYAIPSDPTVSNVNRCDTGQVTITASGSGEGAVYKWFENSTGGSPVYEGEVFEPSLSLSKNYFVSAISADSCVSQNRTEVVATINPVPSSPSVTNGNICGTDSTVLAAGGAPEGGDYLWYESLDSIEVIATGSQFTTPEISESRSYFVSIVNQFDCESERSEVKAIVHDIPDPPVGKDVERCGEGDVTLEVSTEVEDPVVNWYVSATGGQPFSNGTPLTISVSDSSTYYASVVTAAGCESERDTVIVMIEEIIPVDIGADTSLCINSGSFDLTLDLQSGITLEDGVFTGSGIIDGVFYPEITGVGTHVVEFVLSNSIGCYSNGARVISVIDITSDGKELSLATNELSMCANEAAFDLSVLPNIDSGQWQGDGITLDIFDPAGLDPGTYQASYTVEINGCQVIADLSIHILTVPNDPVFSAEPQQICHGDIATLKAAGGPAGTIYHWFIEGQTDSFIQGNSITVQPDQTTVYKVKSENAFGCLSNVVETTVEVISIKADFTVSDTLIAYGDRVDFSTDYGLAQSYLWDFGDNLISTEQNPSHYYYDEGSFTVSLSLVSKDGCEKIIVKKNMITINPNSFDIVTELYEQDHQTEITTFPQPFDEFLTVNIYSQKQTSINIFIHNLTGRVLFEKKISLTEGENRITFYNSEIHLQPGFYLMKFRNENEQKTIKIIKN